MARMLLTAGFRACVMLALLCVVTGEESVTKEQRKLLDEQLSAWNKIQPRGIVFNAAIHRQFLAWAGEKAPFIDTFTEEPLLTESIFTGGEDEITTDNTITTNIPENEITTAITNNTATTENTNIKTTSFEQDNTTLLSIFRSSAVPPAEIHKDIRLMTKQEFKNFLAAYEDRMWTQAVDGRSETITQIFAGYHTSALSPGAHGGPGFIAWHAQYLNAFSNALKGYDSSISLPFIDFRPDTQIPDHCDSCIYTSDLMGNNRGTVNIGTLSNIKVYPPECARNFGAYLSRYCDYSSDYLIGYDQYSYMVNNFAVYNDFVNPFNSYFEDNHGLLHVLNGGHLSQLTCAANDPIFFLLHGFVHSIFDRAMDLRYSYSQQVNLAYSTGSGIRPEFQGTTPARPFTTPLKDCLKQAMQRNMKFVTVPDTCNTDRDCNPTGSDMDAFWCKIPNGSKGGYCATKIRIGGRCEDDTFEKYPNKSCFRQSYCSRAPICAKKDGRDWSVCQCMGRNGVMVSDVDRM